MNNTETEKTNVVELADDQLKEVAGGYIDTRTFKWFPAQLKREQYAKLGLSKEEYQEMKAQMAAKGVSPDVLAIQFKGLC